MWTKSMMIAVSAALTLSAVADDGAKNAVCAYFESLRQADGAYAYPSQDASHLSATYAAVMTYRLMERPVPGDTKKLAGLVAKDLYPVQTRADGTARTRWHAYPLHEYRLQQVRALHALGDKAAAFRSEIDRFSWVSRYMKAYEIGENPILVQLASAIIAKEAYGLAPSAEAKGRFIPYFKTRERADGSFNTTPASDGSGGHVVNTAYALAALRVLGEKTDARVVDWIRACQRKDGGFTWSPKPEKGGVSDLWYTWAAVRALQAAGARPANEAGLRAFLVSLWNDDGGFAPRPGWRSDPMATYRAIDAFRALGWSEGLKRTARRPAIRAAETDMRSWHVWTIQFEAPGSGSVKEAVQVAKDLKIHLWGAKNARKEWIELAQREADRRKVPVTFFPSDEHYGKRRKLPGLGDFTHLRDPATPPVSAKDKKPFELWQMCDHECCARIFLDSGEYDAIGTFHFGCFDMTWLLPFLYQYEGQIPLVSNQDSHGETWWWRDELAAYRTVFLAPGGGWDDFKEACRRGTVASVREDSHTEGRLRILGGTEKMRKILLEKQGDWRIAKTTARASIQILDPESAFEVARPNSGKVLRVRVDRHWHESKGLLNPSCHLARVTHDGAELPIERIVQRHEKKDYLHGIIEEAYDIIRLGDSVGHLELTFAPEPGAKAGAFTTTVDVK